MNELSHYFYLYPAYAVAIFGWIIYSRRSSSDKPNFSNNLIEGKIKKPWMEFVFAILAAVCTILIGQLYIKGLLLPKSGDYSLITVSINQLLIFSPFAILLLVRRQSLRTAWFPNTGKLKSLFVGLALATLALLTFLLLKGRENIVADFIAIYSPNNIPHLVQVFAEDFAISVCLFRLMAWIGPKYAIFVIAALFAGSHIPAMISYGVSIENFTGLILDTLLGVFVLRTLYKSQNFLWFWMIHFAMDMTQFLQ